MPSTDQNFMNNFLRESPKEHSCEIISKCDLLEKIFQEFLHVRLVQVAPFTTAMSIDRSKFRKKILEKGHSRKIPVKLFQIQTSSFREDFLRLSSCPYSARSPHSPEPCL